MHSRCHTAFQTVLVSWEYSKLNFSRLLPKPSLYKMLRDPDPAVGGRFKKHIPQSHYRRLFLDPHCLFYFYRPVFTACARREQAASAQVHWVIRFRPSQEKSHGNHENHQPPSWMVIRFISAVPRKGYSTRRGPVTHQDQLSRSHHKVLEDGTFINPTQIDGRPFCQAKIPKTTVNV